jgi:CheY-like chemotaxis protein
MGHAPLVLVVDDGEDNRALLHELLTLEVGCLVRCACDGLDAMALLQTPDEPLPCLILLDWMMPRMNGAAVLTELGKHPVLAAIPVVVCSAAPDVEAPTAAAIFLKPFNMNVLLALVREHCDCVRAAPPSAKAAAAE